MCLSYTDERHVRLSWDGVSELRGEFGFIVCACIEEAIEKDGLSDHGLGKGAGKGGKGVSWWGGSPNANAPWAGKGAGKGKSGAGSWSGKGPAKGKNSPPSHVFHGDKSGDKGRYWATGRWPVVASSSPPLPGSSSHRAASQPRGLSNKIDLKVDYGRSQRQPAWVQQRKARLWDCRVVVIIV